MATGSSPRALHESFEFARRFRDPTFRKLLAERGWRQEHDVVVALDDEPVSSVVARMVYNGTSSPCLIAIPSDGEPFGFRLLFAIAVELDGPDELGEPIRLAASSSIGMLYASLTPCGAYAPSEWACVMRFQRVPVSC